MVQLILHNNQLNIEITKNRWFALEIKAIDPFISSLPESDQQTLKKELSENYLLNLNILKMLIKKYFDEHAFNIVIKVLLIYFKAKQIID